MALSSSVAEFAKIRLRSRQSMVRSGTVARGSPDDGADHLEKALQGMVGDKRPAPGGPLERAGAARDREDPFVEVEFFVVEHVVFEVQRMAAAVVEHASALDLVNIPNLVSIPPVALDETALKRTSRLGGAGHVHVPDVVLDGDDVKAPGRAELHPLRTSAGTCEGHCAQRTHDENALTERKETLH